MLIALLGLNWLAVALATVAFCGLGALYFTVLVPKYYALALGRQGAPPHQQSPSDYAAQAACTLATTVTSALLMQAMRITTLDEALSFGALVGVGYQVATVFNVAVNPNFPRPGYYGLLNAPFFLVGNLLVCTILVSMQAGH